MDNERKKYRVAVVGGAGMWGRHYLQTFAEREDCDVVLVDSSTSRAKQFAEEFGITDMFVSLDELLQREVPDIVAVANDIIKCANEGFTLEVDVLNSNLLNSLTYIWTLDGVDIQTGPENTYFLNDSAEEFGEFTITVFDDITFCWNTTTINVDFYENSYCVDLPQGLSPNGDGYNDCLILDHLEDIEDIDKIEVFNRYGTKIYEMNEYVDQWCGVDQDGKIVPVGTYFYIIYFNSTKEPITSWIYVNY